jgi:hypothetical protein
MDHFRVFVCAIRINCASITTRENHATIQQGAAMARKSRKASAEEIILEAV